MIHLLDRIQAQLVKTVLENACRCERQKKDGNIASKTGSEEAVDHRAVRQERHVRHQWDPSGSVGSGNARPQATRFLNFGNASFDWTSAAGFDPTPWCGPVATATASALPGLPDEKSTGCWADSDEQEMQTQRQEGTGDESGCRAPRWQRGHRSSW